MTMKWDKRFLDVAALVASWSKDPSTKVGCVIANQDNVVIGMGYNGFPQGNPDAKTILEDKEKKRLRTIHAEMNAQHFLTQSMRGAKVYVTHHPCAACAANLIQRKPSEIIIPTAGLLGLGKDWNESLREAGELCEEHGIKVRIV